MVEVETVRPNCKEHHDHFAAVLRDPNPISPERARELKSARTGSYSRADSSTLISQSFVGGKKSQG